MPTLRPLPALLSLAALTAGPVLPAAQAAAETITRRQPPAPLTAPERPALTPDRTSAPVPRPDRPAPLRIDQLPAGLRSACTVSDSAGGDDLNLDSSPPYGGLTYDSYAMDIADNGEMYVAYMLEDPASGTGIRVLRSTDGGALWFLWDDLLDPDPNINYEHCDLVVPDSVGVARVFINYRVTIGSGNGKIRVSWSDAGPAPVWNSVDALTDPGVDYVFSDLITDDESFTPYYLYLAAEAFVGFSSEIVFTRSLDGGPTWEAPVVIGPDLGDGYNQTPRLSYGDAGVGSATVHCVWSVTGISSADQYAIRHARGTADGSTWGGVTPITSITDPAERYSARIAASPTDGDVVMTYVSQDTTTFAIDTVLRTSSDGGLAWSSPDTTTFADRAVAEVRCLRDGSEFAAGMMDFACLKYVVFRASGASPGTWDSGTALMDEPGWIVRPVIAADPTRGNRWAMFRPRYTGSLASEFYWDAEWRSDPGWPTPDPGFPASLGGPTAESAPAIVDVDGDPSTLEIVFRDTTGDVRVFRSDGTELPGFPAVAGTGGPLAPVAVGDLNGDGTPEIVTSTDAGKVIGLDPSGSVLFSRSFGAGDSTFVTVAPLQPFSLPHVTAIVRDGIHIFTWDGTTLAQVDSVSLGGPHSQSPVSVGDVDADGTPEYVVTAGTEVHVRRMGETAPLFVADLGHPLRQAATLTDTDGDGDLEIAVPTEDGRVYLLHHDGSTVTGFPRITATTLPVTTVSFARLSGGPNPELMFGTAGGALYAVTNSGSLASGFPVTPLGGFPISGGPVVEHIAGAAPSAVVGPTGFHLWSYDAGGTVTTGWPRFNAPSTYPEVAGAVGDIDGDGRNEVVFVSDVIQVYDVGQAPASNDDERWPMEGFDPGRSGCAACPSVGSPVGTEIAGGSDVTASLQLAAPFPNPSRGGVGLVFGLPAPAGVRIEIFDVAGRRISVVEDSRRAAGRHEATWDATTRTGDRVSPGTYFVRLRAAGEDGQRTATRKITLIR